MAIGSINPSLLGVTPGINSAGTTPGSNVDSSGAPLPGYATTSAFGRSKISAKTTSSVGGDAGAANLVNPLIQGYLSNPAPSVGGSASSSGVTTSSGAAVAKAGGDSSTPGKPDYDPVYIILIEPMITKAINNSDPKVQADKNGDESPGLWDDEPDDA